MTRMFRARPSASPDEFVSYEACQAAARREQACAHGGTSLAEASAKCLPGFCTLNVVALALHPQLAANLVPRSGALHNHVCILSEVATAPMCSRWRVAHDKGSIWSSRERHVRSRHASHGNAKQWMLSHLCFSTCVSSRHFTLSTAARAILRSACPACPLHGNCLCILASTLASAGCGFM